MWLYCEKKNPLQNVRNLTIHANYSYGMISIITCYTRKCFCKSNHLQDLQVNFKTKTCCIKIMKICLQSLLQCNIYHQNKPAGCPGADQTCWYFGCSSATMHIKTCDMMTEHINTEAGVFRYEDIIFNKMISENVMLLLTYDQASDHMKTWLQTLAKTFYLKRLWGTFSFCWF